jgi:hypothetical protein
MCCLNRSTNLVHSVIHMIQKERRVNADANNLVTPANAGAHG